MHRFLPRRSDYTPIELITNVYHSTFVIHYIRTNFRRFSFLKSHVLVGVGVGLSSLMLSGCWGSSDPEPEPEAKELRLDKDPLATEVPEAELTRLAKQLYQVGMYTVARDSFSSLKDRYPMGAYAAFAELKRADTFFFNSEFDSAAKSYEDYIKNYPGSPDVPYCKLQAARSHVASARTEGRDRQPWERALVIFDEITSTYPGTAYSAVVQQERLAVIRELSAYDREIIEFYRKEGNTAAVEDREKRFQARWGTRSTEVATEGSPTSSGLALSTLPPVPASAPATESAATTPSDGSHADAAALDGSTTSPSPLIEGRSVIQSVECKGDGKRFGVIEVSRVPEKLKPYDLDPLRIDPVEGVVDIPHLELTARQSRWDCFSSEDLEVTSEGNLKITSQHPISISVLHDPPRLLLSLADTE